MSQSLFFRFVISVGFARESVLRSRVRVLKSSSLSYVGDYLQFPWLHVISLTSLAFELDILSQSEVYVSSSQGSRSRYLNPQLWILCFTYSSEKLG